MLVSLALVASRSCLVADDIGLRAGQIRAYRADFGIGILLYLSDLGGQFFVGFFLSLANILGQGARLRQFGLRESKFLSGHFQLALQIRDARIGLVDLHGEHGLFRVGLCQIGLQLGFRGVAGVNDIADHRRKRAQRPQ